ncbi:MAG: AI-2E family transporter [Janthinobacterium lividum]
MNSPILPSYQRQALIWTVIAFAFGILLWLLSPVLTPFLLGAILAYILQPGVSWLARHRVPRAIGALLMMLVLVVVLTFLVLLILFVVQREGPQVKLQIPLLLTRLQLTLAPKLAALGFPVNLDFTSIRTFITEQFSDSANTIASTVFHSLRTSGSLAIEVIGNLVLVPLVLFYLLYDWHPLIARAATLVPRRWLGKTSSMAGEMDQMLSQYLRGQLLVMAILAAFYSIALTIAGFDIALPIGIFTGLAVIIPYIGYTTGLVLALVAAMLQFGNWYGFGAVFIIYSIGQIAESFYLTPRLVGERIGLHPLAVIFALLVFGQWFGFFGVLLALPASAITLIAMRELRRSYLSSTLYLR